MPARLLDARSPTEVQQVSARVRFRRALALLLMTLLAPGSAQLVAGSRWVGRLALRVVAGLVVGVVLLAVTGLVWPQALSTVLVEPAVLTALRGLLVGCAVGWALLFVDAWRLGDPLALRQPQRLAVVSLNGVLCFAVSGVLLFGSHLVGVHRSFLLEVFAGSAVSQAEDGRYTILLLGGDAGSGRSGLRPDSITLASIDAETGRTVLFGLPRNLEQVPFPESTPMHEAFPDGLDCPGCYLNSVYTWAMDHERRFDPGIDDVGAWATARAVEEITGLTVNYTVVVDMRGFRDLVDAVGGVTVDVPERLPIGGVGGPVTGWIEPGRQHLDGYETLWFARSRATSDDYSRMARQKCLMQAMLRQLSPRTVLANFEELAAAGTRLLRTDIPASEVDTFLQLAAKARRLPVSTVSFVPPAVRTYDPDYEEIRAMVQRALDRAEAADEGERRPAPARPRDRSGPKRSGACS